MGALRVDLGAGTPRKKESSAIDVKNVRAFGFGGEKWFSVELTRVGGKTIGYALYYFTFRPNAVKPVLYLEDLYVRPEYRRRELPILS